MQVFRRQYYLKQLWGIYRLYLLIGNRTHDISIAGIMLCYCVQKGQWVGQLNNTVSK